MTSHTARREVHGSVRSSSFPSAAFPFFFFPIGGCGNQWEFKRAGCSNTPCEDALIFYLPVNLTIHFIRLNVSTSRLPHERENRRIPPTGVIMGIGSPLFFYCPSFLPSHYAHVSTRSRTARAISEQPALLTNLSALSLLSREDPIGGCCHLHSIMIEAERRLLGVHSCPAHLALFFLSFFVTSFCHWLILSSSGPLQVM